MKRPFKYYAHRLATISALTILAGGLVSQTVFAAQPPEGPGGGPGGPGGGPGGRGGGPGGPGGRGGGPGGPGGPGGGRRNGGRPRPLSVTTIPAKALASALLLSDSQTAKIAAIQDALQKERQKMMPAPGVGPATPPDRETMQANREKMRGLETKATSDIEAVLTPEQKSAVPDLIKTMDVLGRAGVSPEIFADLKLTVDQKAQLAALPVPAPPRRDGAGGGGGGGTPPDREAMAQSRKQADERVMAILTADQKKIVETFQEAHPRPQPGDGGGRPRPGDGGPPPPGGGDPPPPPPAQ